MILNILALVFIRKGIYLPYLNIFSLQNVQQHNIGIQQDVNGYEAASILSEPSIRKGFIAKVYIILLVQIMVTVICCYISVSIHEVSDFMKTHWTILITMILVSFVIIIVLGCS